ncbi:hypothetical protein CAPN006_11420 [Capnocytophaga canimorsus]|uniref:hypothetical protein n=1 Tax=Capnocytophaga canimorsus TaxID=28188 RepID=UPI001ACD6594|nr:hypothetical protein [Capnocytophaga canimorsus]GIM56748.1 hypothetical protein CAPN006_11420 [Capnocytophaga canimorsus]
MKKLLLFSVILICLMACATKKQSIFTNLDCSKYSILDSLAYIEFPNEYDFYVEEVGLIQRKGNSIFHKIKNSNEKIIPCLIEKIKDTTYTNIIYADSYNYTYSDVSFFMLEYTQSKQPININDILYEEFKKDFLKGNLFPFEQKIMIVFFTNDAQTNYNNRLRLYKRLKRWYLENYITKR